MRVLAAAIALTLTVPHSCSIAAQTVAAPRYEPHAVHDPDGTGTFYMGREIAQVMGPGGMEWLDRAQRDTDEHPSQVLSALQLHFGEVVADLGAGSGYFTFRMAPRVGNTGKVLAVDVQPEMLRTLRQRGAAQKITNVEVIQASRLRRTYLLPEFYGSTHDAIDWLGKRCARLINGDMQEAHWLAARRRLAVLPVDAADAKPRDLVTAQP